jgi:aspartyl-tRNA(Asn)/glutamyl-tRNA(Gln) amidotransferase subunit A
MPTDLALMSAPELVALFRAGSVSPVEATQAVLAQIARLNPVLNAFCWLDEEAALKAARDSEARWHQGQPLSAVDGVTATVKDLSVTHGWPTRRASPALTAIADQGLWNEDSPSVARMREAGAVLLGKTTVPEFGASLITKSALCGVTRNPWNPLMTPGGSSGGASASVAAGMGTLALGSDAAGSIRVPAAMSGIFGLKTTHGRVPDYPSSYLGTLAIVGPMTRSVTEAALMMDVITRPDARDSYALPSPHESFLAGLDHGVAGLRIAYCPTLGGGQVDPEVQALVASGVKLLESLGAQVELVDDFIGSTAATLKNLMLPGLANAFRIFGFTAAHKALMRPGLVDAAHLGAQVPVLDFLAAREASETLGATMRAFHQRFDLLVSPVTSVPCCEAQADGVTDPRYAHLGELSPFTPVFNLTRQPAASVPVGLTAEGMPVGMQVVGPLYSDALVLRACRAIEMARPFARPDLAALAQVTPDDAVPRGIASQRAALAAGAA